MSLNRPTERADLAFDDLSPEEREEVTRTFATTFGNAAGWERRVFFTRWVDGKWSACATRPLFARPKGK